MVLEVIIKEQKSRSGDHSPKRIGWRRSDSTGLNTPETLFVKSAVSPKNTRENQRRVRSQLQDIQDIRLFFL